MTVETHTGIIPTRATRQRQLILILGRVWAWVFLSAMIIFFAISVNVFQGISFLTIRNSQNILVAIVPILLMGLGQTFVIISGGIDLSVGWLYGLASVVSALVIRGLAGDGKDIATVYLAILIGFLAGMAASAFCGLISGAIIAKLRVPSFIVTLGMSFIARGVAFLLSGGNVVGGQPLQLRDIGNESLFYLLGGEGGGLFILQKPNVTGDALQRLDRIFPWPVVVAAFALAIGLFLLHKTQFGRHTFAIGGNREASLRAGIPVDRHTMALYIMSGLTAGLAGILHTARYWGGSPIAGDPLLLSSIAAVIIGGVSMFGGRGTLAGTLIGALIIAIMTTGLVMLNVQPFWQFIVVGVVVILAVLIDQARDLVIGRADQGEIMTEPMLSFRNLVKRFGGLVAVNQVSFDVYPGEVVGLVGDNAAGKSTLIKCVSGVYQPDEGEVFFQGRRVHFPRPIEARKAGIETIYQDLALAGNLHVGANIFMGREVKKRYLGGLIATLDEAYMLAESRKVLDTLEIRIPSLTQEIEKLSGGQRQAVAIARAVYWNAKLMIMDEPTNNLGVIEQRKVLELIQRLRQQGVPVILISHTMPDVFGVTDRIVVMHRGRKVTEKRTADTNSQEIVQYMVGALDDTRESAGEMNVLAT